MSWQEEVDISHSSTEMLLNSNEIVLSTVILRTTKENVHSRQ